MPIHIEYTIGHFYIAIGRQFPIVAVEQNGGHADYARVQNARHDVVEIMKNLK